ncbi:Glycosidase [Thioalkalivibrio nitratireducens DSM 14787]|uniref:Glycosidase n=1 Tax=Thioalkalivibrio nitratireducens (strain DSM 14787 / UNIQEM 213 / ALEN2) TaxID=1255043 RepID=L0DWD8_THIND|nr:alpha-amylase family glycosyl hydrolase [Thioalkalivibrio nitratireducens]AGA33332.1 Glycosidase [Thioalkalivibrio nitratireducens DSM 14787]
MEFTHEGLQRARFEHVRDVRLPRRTPFHPSPSSWRDEVLYFLLVDRFSDGAEETRPLLDRSNRGTGRPALGGEPWRWDRWAQSGRDRWQGGTLQGVRSKLGYLKRLGVTALWLSPVFKQRGHLDSYHGYGVQDFLEVDPRLGSRADLVELVQAAHAEGLRVILDIIFNHSGENWTYPPELPGGPYTPHYTAGRHPFGAWRGPLGEPVEQIVDPEHGVWPTELQDPERYTRAGSGNLGAGDLEDPHAEHKRTDFITLRDFDLQAPGLLNDLARCFKYWIALTDCDGFRLDTLKHVSFEEARNFCGTVKEFAANIGKADFLLIGEIAGGDYNQTRYLDVLARNLDAALDIGEMRVSLTGLAKGLQHPLGYFAGFDPGFAVMGSHRNLGDRHVSILDDHDHVFGAKIRFAAEASNEHQGAVAAALQLFTLGIPCVYYGTEQALAGPEPSEHHWLPGWKGSDVYLREAMFGPVHPRKGGRDGLPDIPDNLDTSLPGFGPFGTAGHHCFDESYGLYRRMAALAALRGALPVLRHGRQYLRPISFLGMPFEVRGPGELIAWSRILDDEESLCVANPHGTDRRGADVIVDASLNPPGAAMTVLLNTAEVADPQAGAAHPAGSELPVRRRGDGTAFVEIRNLPPSEVLVLSNHAGVG